MAIVIDANLILGAAIPQPYSSLIIAKLSEWRQDGEHLIAPNLLEYEVTAALQRAITMGLLDRKKAETILGVILSLGIDLIYPSRETHLDALRWAERIGQSKTCDAQYLALASRENAPLWTADRRLYNAARQAGLDWIHWVGDADAMV